MVESAPRVVFFVPKQHVKAVKSALERAGQLDRSSKITPESDDQGQWTSLFSSNASEQDANPPDSVEYRADTGTTLPNLTQQPRFPRLQFDMISGEYVDPSFLADRVQHEEQMGQNQHLGLTNEVSSEPENQTTCSDVTIGEHAELSPSTTAGEKSRGLDQQRMRIATNVPCPWHVDVSREVKHAEEIESLKWRMMEDLALGEIAKYISISYHVPSTIASLEWANQSPVRKALGKTLESLLGSVPSSQALTVETLMAAFPEGYSVYRPMLLLPHNALSSTPWKSLIAAHPVDSDAMSTVWHDMAEAVDATHVAINSPIPISTTPTSVSPVNATSNENVLRSPVNLIPLYGDFGPAPTPQSIMSPTATDMADALWVIARQNGIWQTWAPLYTMFSRGNIREKARILALPSVTTYLDEASAAADLYAGIGYFAFSYKKSGEGLETGIKNVVCWEINPWSVEGLRRGAEMNGWTCRVLKNGEMERLRSTYPEDDSYFHSTDLVVFQASNEGAELDYALLPSPKPPIRHVNLGLLPSSKLSWDVAVKVLDKWRGGWIHVHENVAIKDIESRKNAVEADFRNLVESSDDVRRTKVSVEHVERVKMYAPGVVHCVFDVLVQGEI